MSILCNKSQVNPNNTKIVYISGKKLQFYNMQLNQICPTDEIALNHWSSKFEFRLKSLKKFFRIKVKR